MALATIDAKFIESWISSRLRAFGRASVKPVSVPACFQAATTFLPSAMTGRRRWRGCRRPVAAPAPTGQQTRRRCRTSSCRRRRVTRATWARTADTPVSMLCISLSTEQ